MRKTPAKNPTLSEAPAATFPPQQLSTVDPDLPTDVFVLGDRVFPLKDLSYDRYVSFLGYLTPLIEIVIQKVAGTNGISIPGIDLRNESFSATNILKLCGKELPEMVQLMCAESDPTITAEDVKKLGGKPTTLVVALIKQIVKNEMIADFTEFFKQVLTGVKPLTRDPIQST